MKLCKIICLIFGAHKVIQINSSKLTSCETHTHLIYAIKELLTQHVISTFWVWLQVIVLACSIVSHRLRKCDIIT